MKKPCINCGTPATGTRCPKCEGAHQHVKNRAATARRRTTGQHAKAYDHQYRKARQQLLATATHCHICGGPPTNNDPFQADHIIPVKHAGGAGPLAAAHRSCNIAKANRERHNHTTKPNRNQP